MKSTLRNAHQAALGLAVAKPRKKPRVMVVDDEKLIGLTVALILKRNGFEANAYSNPIDALKAAALEAPDLLISDVVMPEMSGVELAIQILSGFPKCKVLLFSGQAMTADLLEEARRQGHTFELLPKPVHPNDLLAAARRNFDDSEQQAL